MTISERQGQGAASRNLRPQIDRGAWIAPNATVVGDVRIGTGAGVWYSAVLRADCSSIRIDERSNIQDGCVLHGDPGFSVLVGGGVSVGHRAVLHGCRIEDDVLVGMGAIIMNGATVGSGSIIGAGALVSEGVTIPPNSLVVGMPAKVVRATTSREQTSIRTNAAQYVALRPI